MSRLRASQGPRLGCVVLLLTLQPGAADAQLFSDAARTEFFGALGVRTGMSVLRKTRLFLDGERAPGDAPEISVVATPLALVYGLRPGLSLIAVVPIVDRTYRGVGAGTQRAIGDRGLGDALLWVKRRFYKRDAGRHSRQLSVQFGLKLSTGPHDLTDDEGRRLPPPLQLGSGATDIDIAVTLTDARDRLFWTGDIGYRSRRESDSFEFGDELRYDAAVKYRVRPSNYGGRTTPRDLFASVEVNARWTASNRDNGTKIADSGGHVVFAAPGLQLFVRPNLMTEVGVQVPVFQELNGLQLGTDFVLRTGLRWFIVP